MNVNASIQKAVQFIAGQENFSPSAYWDSNGYAIGFGNHYYQDGSAVRPGDTIAESAAWDLLTYYAAQNANALVPQLAVDLNTNQLAALTSIRYNCGTITVSLLNLINSGASPDQIADQITQTCITSGGQVNPVLIERRGREADLYTKMDLSWIALAAIYAAGVWAIYKA